MGVVSLRVFDSADADQWCSVALWWLCVRTGSLWPAITERCVAFVHGGSRTIRMDRVDGRGILYRSTINPIDTV